MNNVDLQEIYTPFRVKVFGLKKTIRFIRPDEQIEKGDVWQLITPYIVDIKDINRRIELANQARADIKNHSRAAAGFSVQDNPSDFGKPSEHTFRIYFRILN